MAHQSDRHARCESKHSHPCPPPLPTRWLQFTKSARVLWLRRACGREPDAGLWSTWCAGHVDFSYEVSRALAACEGALLLVDSSQGKTDCKPRQWPHSACCPLRRLTTGWTFVLPGVQAQTVANYNSILKASLAVVGAASQNGGLLLAQRLNFSGVRPFVGCSDTWLVLPPWLIGRFPY